MGENDLTTIGPELRDAVLKNKKAVALVNLLQKYEADSKEEQKKLYIEGSKLIDSQPELAPLLSPMLMFGVLRAQIITMKPVVGMTKDYMKKSKLVFNSQCKEVTFPLAQLIVEIQSLKKLLNDRVQE